MARAEDHQAKWAKHFSQGGRVKARSKIQATEPRSVRPKRKPPAEAVRLQDTPTGGLNGQTAPAAQGHDARLMLVKLQSDQGRISLNASRQKQHEIQAEVLPSYQDYLLKAMENPSGGEDPVLIQCMIWRFNLGQIEQAQALADHAIKYGLSMPKEFKVNTQQFVCREIAYWALDQQANGNDPEPYLSDIYQQSRAWDKPDQIEARLLKAKGNQLVETDPAAALALFEQAAPLDERIGVSQIIKRLVKQLANSDAPEETEQQQQ